MCTKIAEKTKKKGVTKNINFSFLDCVKNNGNLWIIIGAGLQKMPYVGRTWAT
jgi:hypothetical protein